VRVYRPGISVERVAALQAARPARCRCWRRSHPQLGRPGQLVHGDFWDGNVYVRAEKLVAVADLDFMGNRPRVDDLALTLYFTDEEMQLAHDADRPAEERIATLRPIVRAYAAALSTR
jgi:Ser/Thr protein kinase RdoA (MazF antagonist)